MMRQKITLYWFRQDLRLADNPALHLAAQAGTVLPIYILDDAEAGAFAMGGASHCWLHHALAALNQSLEGSLSLYAGDAATIIDDLIARHQISHVYWNRCYEPWRVARDSSIKKNLQSRGITVSSENGSLLWEPWEINNRQGEPYKVFTPFYQRGCLAAAPPRKPLATPANLQTMADPQATNLESLALLPTKNWAQTLPTGWKIGEDHAHERLADFLDADIAEYQLGRDFPIRRNVSRLSPALHFGALSPNQIWYAARDLPNTQDTAHFCSELAWREFSYHLLFHRPELPTKNIQSKFDGFPWQDDPALLRAWQLGQTGIPMVDAGMRELWQTGYMHNRVRMIVGSFLVKNLLIDWRAGFAWFWDTLFDADLANNAAGWQWIAGCGADAAPYFRIFNPVLQGKRFDPEGEYVRQYIPELAGLPAKHVHAPWHAPTDILKKAGIRLGENYPRPIVDLAASRKRALEVYQSLIPEHKRSAREGEDDA